MCLDCPLLSRDLWKIIFFRGCIVAIVLLTFLYLLSAPISFPVIPADYALKYVHPCTHGPKTRSQDQTFNTWCLKWADWRDWSWHLHTPVWGNTFFSPCRDIELDMQACSRLHTCTNCVNSSTVVASWTQNADESHHLWPRYNNILCAASYVYEPMCVTRFRVGFPSLKVFFPGSWLDVGHTHIHTEKKKPSTPVWVSLSPLCRFTLGSMTVIWSKRLYKDFDWGKLKPVVRV